VREGVHDSTLLQADTDTHHFSPTYIAASFPLATIAAALVHAPLSHHFLADPKKVHMAVAMHMQLSSGVAARTGSVSLRRIVVRGPRTLTGL
jgi:hypothetical protein